MNEKHIDHLMNRRLEILKEYEHAVSMMGCSEHYKDQCFEYRKMIEGIDKILHNEKTIGKECEENTYCKRYIFVKPHLLEKAGSVLEYAKTEITRTTELGTYNNQEIKKLLLEGVIEEGNL